MKDLNLRYAEIIRERYEENSASAKDAIAHMEAGSAIYRGVPVACLYMPKLFSEAAWEHLQQAAATICTILDKVIQRYLDDAMYRKLFPFSTELEQLILTEAGYPRLLPIARLDIFFNEEDFSFQFCEFNADGASAMNENREINAALQQSDALIKMREAYDITAFEYFDSWVKEFMEIYGSYHKKVASPSVVIADFMEGATVNEFIEFKDAFLRAGIDCDICEIRELVCVDGELRTPDGKKVDAVYRRAVTRDIMEHIDEVAALLQADVCIIGHFRTQIIHNKTIFSILRMPETFAFLTGEEQAYILKHIPETMPLENGVFDLEDVLTNKDSWIIKPEDLYASRGVYAGIDMDPEAWRKAVTEAIGTGYLLQRYCTPYQSLNIDFNKEARPDFAMYNNITGMYVYNGKLKGLYSRAGQMGTISSYAQGLTMASLLVREKY